MKPAGDNPTGYWEKQDVVDLNDALLAGMGMQWDSPNPVPRVDANAELIKPILDQIVATLDREFGSSTIWGIKDPRLCRLVPLWRSVLPALDVRPSFVISIRHPFEVAASLHARDGFDTAKSIQLWLLHVLEVERETRSERRVIVRYDDLLADWRSTVCRINGRLGLGLAPPTSCVAEQIEDFLKPQLRHHRHIDTASKEQQSELESLAIDVFGLMTHHAADRRDSISELDRAYFRVCQVAAVDEGARYAAALEKPYQQWINKHALNESQGQLMAERMLTTWSSQPSMHLIVVVQPGQESLLADTIECLGQQLYRAWGLTVFAASPCLDPAFEELEMLEWIRADGDVTEQVNRAIRETGADWVALLEAGDRFEPHLLFSCVDYINIRPEWKFIYVDEDRIDDHGRRHSPRFKPDFNLDLLRSTPYPGSFCLLNRRALEAVGGFVERGGQENYDVVFRLLERFGEGAIGHIAEMLYHRLDANDVMTDAALRQEAGKEVLVAHLRRAGVAAEVQHGLVPMSYFVEYRHSQKPMVSILIPTKDQFRYLKTCVDSLLENTTYPNYEVLIVDNNTSEPEALEYLTDLDSTRDNIRVLRYPHPYNYSAMNNAAAREARGEYLLLLNNDTVVVQENWLERMMNQGQRPEVGTVGVRLVFPDQRIQHAGVVVGMTGTADHVGIGLPMQQPGHMGRMQMAQNYSAVTAACLLVRKSLFFQVGGFDEERLKVLFNDVDLCLKIGEAGYKIVWTPFVTLIHHGSVSLYQKNRNKRSDPEQMERARRENATMLERWLPKLTSDPAYNRHLSLVKRHWNLELETDVIWDRNLPGPLRIIAGGLVDGSSMCRVQEPLQTLQQHGQLQCAFLPADENRARVPSIAELERAQPEVLLLHNAIRDLQLKGLERYRRFNDVFTVFSQDDLVLQALQKMWLNQSDYKDVPERLRKAVALSDRLLVATAPLAEAYADITDEVRIVPDYLRRDVWESLISRRRQSAKPRVGWAVVQQQPEDLALLTEVVRATAAEVEWVCFGMCPDAIKPYLTEIHSGVQYQQYPDKLASLNLDLAVAPLAHNRFNDAKSNRGVLEYGAVGWPVVCTDIEPYRGAPVKRVPNNTQSWVNAILERVNDLDAASEEGDRLRQWVLNNWMLEDHLEEWLEALTPVAAASRSAATISL